MPPRLVYACGAAATTATLATVAADYPDNDSRGKFLGVLLVTQQLTILFLVANAAARLPRLLVAHGVGRILAGQLIFRGAALVALVGALVAFTALYRGTAPGARAAPAVRVGEAAGRIVAQVRGSPRFALVLVIAFVARGDTAVMSSFLSLWAVKTATAGGASQPGAIAIAGGLLSVVTICGMASAAVTGWLADRVDRLAPLTAGLAAAGIGNMAICAVHDLGRWPVYAVVGVVAAAETAVIICGQTVLGEEAPATARGAAVGAFGVCGSTGVLALLAVGGVLFDRISPQAPFVLVGAVNLAAGVAAAAVWIRRPRLVNQIA